MDGGDAPRCGLRGGQAQDGPRRALRPGETRVEALGLDPFARLALAAMRGYCQSFAAPPSQGWLGSMQLAARHLGPEAAAPFCFDLLALVLALRAARRTTFHFSNPGCPCCRDVLTAEERQLMGLLDALREGRRGTAAANALLLSEGEPSEALIEAAAAFVARHAPRPVGVRPGQARMGEETGPDRG